MSDVGSCTGREWGRCALQTLGYGGVLVGALGIIGLIGRSLGWHVCPSFSHKELQIITGSGSMFAVGSLTVVMCASTKSPRSSPPKIMGDGVHTERAKENQDSALPCPSGYSSVYAEALKRLEDTAPPLYVAGEQFHWTNIMDTVVLMNQWQTDDNKSYLQFIQLVHGERIQTMTKEEIVDECGTKAPRWIPKIFQEEILPHPLLLLRLCSDPRGNFKNPLEQAKREYAPLEFSKSEHLGDDAPIFLGSHFVISYSRLQTICTELDQIKSRDETFYQHIVDACREFDYDVDIYATLPEPEYGCSFLREPHDSSNESVIPYEFAAIIVMFADKSFDYRGYVQSKLSRLAQHALFCEYNGYSPLQIRNYECTWESLRKALGGLALLSWKHPKLFTNFVASSKGFSGATLSELDKSKLESPCYGLDLDYRADPAGLFASRYINITSRIKIQEEHINSRGFCQASRQ